MPIDSVFDHFDTVGQEEEKHEEFKTVTRDELREDNETPVFEKILDKKDNPEPVEEEKEEEPGAQPEMQMEGEHKEVIESDPVMEAESKGEEAEPSLKKKAINDEIKKLTAQWNDESYEVPVEAKVKHKVNKEEVEISIQELLNNYAGKEDWTKKYSELDRDQKQIRGIIQDFATAVKESPEKGLMVLAQHAGQDMFKFKQALRKEFAEKYQDYLYMDEDERARVDRDEELEYMRQLEVERNNQATKRQADQELLNRFNQVATQYNMEWSELEQIAADVKEVFNSDVTPENVAYVKEYYTRLDRAESALSRVSPETEWADENVAQLESLIKGNPQITDDQIFDYANRLWGDKVEQKIEKLNKIAEKKKQPKKEVVKKPVAPKNERMGRVDFFG